MKFDTFHPAVNKGLPVTRVISRFVLQKLLAEACEKLAGKELILNDCVVSDFEEKVGSVVLSSRNSPVVLLLKHESSPLIGNTAIPSAVSWMPSNVL